MTGEHAESPIVVPGPGVGPTAGFPSVGFVDVAAFVVVVDFVEARQNGTG